MQRPIGLPSVGRIAELPRDPLRILVSACLGGRPCGVDGTCYGKYSSVDALLALPNVAATLVCPEEQAFGTPRSTCNIIKGDGFDVLAGRARVVTHEGADWTDKLMAAADRMVKLALEKKIDLALLMDISAACGSSVIYDGHRDLKNYRHGVGVCTARLIEAGIPVLSQRDLFSLEHLHKHLNPDHIVAAARDHYRGQWYQEYFNQHGR